MKKICFFLFLMFLSQTYSQSIELLRFFEDDIQFTNIISYDKKVFIGSDKGVFQYKNMEISLHDDEILGFIQWNQFANKLQRVDKSIVEFLKDDAFLSKQIPFEYRSDISVVEVGSIMVVAASGKLFVYKKLPYSKELKGISVRSLSSSIISSYSGLFDRSTLSNLRLDSPLYANGYTRDFNGLTFVCFDGLAIIENGELKDEFSVINQELRPEFGIGSLAYGYIRDIAHLVEDRFLIATTKGIYQFDYGERSVVQVDKVLDSIDPIIIHQEEMGLVWYIINGELKGYNFPDLSELNRLPVYTHPYSVMDADVNIFGNGFVSPNFYLAAENGLVRATYSQENKADILNNSSFSTVKALNDSTLVLSNNQGLYRFDLKKRKLNLFLSDEFNKKAIEIVGDTIYAGSINGLYKVSKSDFLDFSSTLDRIDLVTIIGLIKRYRDVGYVVIVLIAVIIMWLRGRNKESRSSRAQIEQYINNNLSKVTVSDVMSEFNLSYNRINSLLKPLTVAQYIRESRLVKIKELKAQNFSINKIAERTGYNVQYLQRVLREINKGE